VAEKQRLAEERAEKAKREQERLAQERARAEAEQARLAAERAEAERARLAALRLEAEKQRLVAERLEQVRLEQERLAAEAALAAAAQTAALTTGPNVVVAQEPIPVIAPVGPLAALKDIYAQRDTRRTVSVSMPRDTLRINQDMFTMTVTSSHAGFVYVLLLGSDETSFYMLFPNALDQANRIEANKPMRLPRPHWGVNAAGPPGTDQLLVIVTETARDLSVLPSAVTSAENPFTLTPADIGGRRQLVDFVIGTGVSGASRFGASWTTVKEVR
jgi:multidrug efflux pump subunit AcrA (membrane-fusion protein)